MLLLHWMSFKTSTDLQAQPASYSGNSPDSLEGFRGSLMADISGYITCQILSYPRKNEQAFLGFEDQPVWAFSLC
ncbi:Nuclear Factor Of Activated T-Cells, Cytoplasmic 3 [Manis pentadactyla]|nr:Nuclear Factor Of Activated T-Cells, Cytoplasmic 3 [Manis pentadactyla]